MTPPPPAPPPPPPQPGQDSLPVLVDDLIAEILLRLPPPEPECLFRASLVCKRWSRLLSNRAFLRRYREFHRAPPVLGFLHTLAAVARFVPTTAFRPPDFDHNFAIGCHHGRALLRDRRSPDFLILWDPMTNEKQYVRHPDIPMTSSNALVFCATPGCDHLDCHGGPFLVAFVGFDAGDGGARACLYSSETGAWSTPSYLQLDSYLDPLPPVLVGDALYLSCDSGLTIMRYDFAGDRGLSLIEPPEVYEDGIVLMPAEDGGLGVAGLDGSTLYLWSLKTGPGGVAGWKTRGVIKLEMLPIGDPRSWRHLIGFSKGCTSGIVFVRTDAGVFLIDLKSQRATKVCNDGRFSVIFPYTSFCTPAERPIWRFGIERGDGGGERVSHRSVSTEERRVALRRFRLNQRQWQRGGWRGRVVAAGGLSLAVGRFMAGSVRRWASTQGSASIGPLSLTAGEIPCAAWSLRRVIGGRSSTAWSIMKLKVVSFLPNVPMFFSF